jgi:hypothetical protein
VTLENWRAFAARAFLVRVILYKPKKLQAQEKSHGAAPWLSEADQESISGSLFGLHGLRRGGSGQRIKGYV